MGCFICKQLKAQHYEEKAGDCWFCMSVNVLIAGAIAAGIWAVGAPPWAAWAALAAMMFRIGHTGFLLPNTPQWLPYVDFIFRPFGYAPSEGEMLSEMAEDVVEVCEDRYDAEDDKQQCVDDVVEIVMVMQQGDLTEAEFYAALGTALNLPPEKMRDVVTRDLSAASD